MHPDVVLREVAKEFRERREERGLTREELAERADVHVNTVANVENGRSDTGVITLFKVAGGLNIPLAELIASIAAQVELR